MLHKTIHHNILEATNTGEKLLKKNTPTPRLESEILLSFVLKKNKEFLYSNFNINISNSEYKLFLKLIYKRKKNYPIAYLIEKKEFYNNIYNVSDGVLIPRPETEELIELALNKINIRLNKNKIFRILEIGAGTGCIPITLKSILKQKISITSYEISKKAFNILITNYKSIKPGRISFINKDAFKETSYSKKYDLIISNPPYLSSKDMEKLDIDVRFEPKTALFGGTNGLVFYDKLKILLNHQLKKDGIALFEINENLREKTAAIFNKEYSCEIIKDLFGKDRFIFISAL